MIVIECRDLDIATEQAIKTHVVNAVQKLTMKSIPLDSEASFNSIIEDYRRTTNNPVLQKLSNREIHFLIQTQKVSSWGKTPKYCTLQLFGFLNVILFNQYWGLTKPNIDELIVLITQSVNLYVKESNYYNESQDWTFELSYTIPTLAWVITASTRRIPIELRVNTLLLNKFYVLSEINFSKEYTNKVKKIGTYFYFFSDYELIKIEYELGTGTFDTRELQKAITDNIEDLFDNNFKATKENEFLLAKTSYQKFGNAISFDFEQGLDKVNHYGIIKDSSLQLTYVYNHNDLFSSSCISEVVVTDALFKVLA